MAEKIDRETLIKQLMENHNMTRKEAEFAADVELGVLPKGDVIEGEGNDVSN